MDRFQCREYKYAQQQQFNNAENAKGVKTGVTASHTFLSSYL